VEFGELARWSLLGRLASLRISATPSQQDQLSARQLEQDEILSSERLVGLRTTPRTCISVDRPACSLGSKQQPSSNHHRRSQSTHLQRGVLARHNGRSIALRHRFRRPRGRVESPCRRIVERQDGLRVEQVPAAWPRDKMYSDGKKA
jgi:hypothetical protein